MTVLIEAQSALYYDQRRVFINDYGVLEIVPNQVVGRWVSITTMGGIG